jgi:hypothetical protein
MWILDVTEKTNITVKQVNCLGWESVEGGKLEETGKRA